MLQKAAKWRTENKDKSNGYTIAYAHRHPKRYILNTARHRAKTRGIEFSITESDVDMPETCPVFGFPLRLGVGRTGKPGGNFDSPSLDRIDSTLGYIAGNVQVLSHLANSMKGAATREQLEIFARWILRGKH